MPLNTYYSKKKARKRLLTRKTLFVDGEEQPVRRSVDSEDQRLHYSGKKKRHTAKVLVITSEKNKIEAITPVYYGSNHDFAIYKEEKIYDILPPKTPIYTDTGFEGIDSLGKNLNIRKPKKKKKGRRLNGGEQLGNRIISRTRVKVEHAIGGMKIFRLAAETFRGITRSMDRTVGIAAGLWNLKVECSHSR